MSQFATVFFYPPFAERIGEVFILLHVFLFGQRFLSNPPADSRQILHAGWPPVCSSIFQVLLKSVCDLHARTSNEKFLAFSPSDYSVSILTSSPLLSCHSGSTATVEIWRHIDF